LAVVPLLERAARLSILTDEARADLAATLTYQLSDFLHLDLILEVAGLATRHGWLVEVETPLGTGRQPDVRLTRRGAAFTIEVTRMGVDREWRAADRWFDMLNMGLLQIESQHGVTASGDASAVDAVAAVDLPGFLDHVREAAVAVHRDGQPRTVSVEGLVITVQQDAPEKRRLDGPPIGGDMWPRLARRLTTKAEQTVGGPPAWIRVDEQGGLFAVTDWATAPPNEQLARLIHNVQATLAGFTHVRGVILSHGTTPGSNETTVIGSDVTEHRALRIGPALVDRTLPRRRLSRTLVVPVESPRIVLPDHLEPEPTAWYATEPSWLDWALHRCEQPPLDRILNRSS
jgi:hypothetical protein